MNGAIYGRHDGLRKIRIFLRGVWRHQVSQSNRGTDSRNTASDHVRGLYWAEPSALFRSLGKERLQLWLDLGAFAVGALNLLRVVLADRHGQVKSLTALLTYVFIDRHRITSHPALTVGEQDVRHTLAGEIIKDLFTGLNIHTISLFASMDLSMGHDHSTDHITVPCQIRLFPF